MDKKSTIIDKKLSLFNVLKKTSKGIRLYSLIYGNCEFVGIKDNGNYPIRCKTVGRNHNKAFSINERARTLLNLKSIFYSNKYKILWTRN